MELSKIIDDYEWSCTHKEVIIKDNNTNIKVCFIEVNDIKCIASELSKFVIDSSWMTKLDETAQIAYKYTVNETAKELEKICIQATNQNNVAKEFGEIMVSMGALRLLTKIFNHFSLPLAELWKSKVRGNDGFDFHTICPINLINFGEAKFSSNENPYSDAINQIKQFIVQEKHFRDIVHLKNLSKSSDPVDNLVKKQFGVVAAFSVNSSNINLIMQNAINSITESDLTNSAQTIYLVGVILCQI